MATKPFLKWAGGKTRVAPNILPHLKGATRLVEPFAGSCALYLQSDIQDALLCDVNPDLIRLYQTLKKHKGAFIDWVETTYFQNKNSLTDFMALRARFNDLKDIDVNELDDATSWERSGIFIYLNRHAFNGMCRYNKSGGYNVPYGKYKSVYFPRTEMEAFYQRAAHVTFKCQSFQTTLANEIKAPHVGTMIYCDPPYIELSQTASFTAYATDGFPVHLQEELAIAAFQAAKAGMPTLISNHDVEPARRLYEKARTFDDSAPLTAADPPASSPISMCAVPFPPKVTNAEKRLSFLPFTNNLSRIKLKTPYFSEGSLNNTKHFECVNLPGLKSEASGSRSAFPHV